MRLTDIMSHMDLSVYPQIALVIFLLVFASVVWRLFRRHAAAGFAAHASLPLDDSPIVDGNPAAQQNERTTS